MPDLTTTIKTIKSYDPCKDGFKKLIDSLPGYTDDTEVSLSYVLENNGVKDAIWFLRCFEYRKYCMFCADVAETVLHLFEKKFPNDNRPRNAINAIRKYYRREIEKDELIAYVSDAYAAYAACDSYVAAAFAVYAAAAAVAACDSYTTASATATANAADDADVQWKTIEQLLIKFIER